MCKNPYLVPFIKKPDGSIRLLWKYPFIKHFRLANGDFDIPNGLISIPCGKCVECCKAYSMEWANRCLCEKMLHKQSCFITLTYKDNPVSLIKRDYQLFLKRLRRRINVPIRYFGCGEYGAKGRRPHFHFIIFGWSPDDLVFLYKTKKGSLIYKSDFVADVWQISNPRAGFISVGEVTLETCVYSAKYLAKLNPPPPGCIPPFCVMSRKPGIGFGFFDEEKAGLSSITVDGHTFRPPRYIRRKFNYKNTLERLYFYSKKIK